MAFWMRSERDWDGRDMAVMRAGGAGGFELGRSGRVGRIDVERYLSGEVMRADQVTFFGETAPRRLQSSPGRYLLRPEEFSC